MIVWILIVISLALIALITTIGNLIVLFAFYYDKKLRTTNDYFIMNMAIADFLVGFFCIPFYIPFSITQSWPFGRRFCQIWVTIDDVATMASVINIVAISINRYWLIAYPISYRKYIRKKFIYLVMIIIWLISFINFAPGIWLINFFNKNEKNINDCSGDYNRSFIYMLIAQFNYFICPFILLCIFNLLIMLNIWKRTRKMSRLRSFQLEKNNSPDEKSSQSKRSSSKMLTKKSKSQSNRQETNAYKTYLIEAYSPIIETKRETIQKWNYLDKPKKLTNRNLIKDHHSSPSVIVSIKCSNINSPISENNENNLIVDNHLQTELQFIKRINHQIKDDRCIIQRDLRINRDRKAARSLFILVFVFLIFLFPYVICATALTAGFQISQTLFQISFWLLWLNSTFNPFIYPFIQNKYRRAYAKLFQSCFKRSN